MKETVYHGCSITGLTWEEFEVVRDALAEFRIDKQNAERALQILDCMKEQLAELKSIGYTLRNQRDEYISTISVKKI